MGSRPTPDFSRFIADLARELDSRRIPYMLIGGQAVLVHGRPRLTEDIDVTLGMGPTELSKILDLCLVLGLDPLPEAAADFVEETFVLPAHHGGSGIRVDFIFSTTPYERQAIERAIQLDVAGVPVSFAAAEDLVIHKLFAGRARDLDDVTAVVWRKGHNLDWAYLEHWAEQFASVPGREGMPEQVADLRHRARG
jgi:predicted nucleotidyltransferase